MINIDNKKDCSGCYACAQSCPKSCITMRQDEEGFSYPSVDKKGCIDCGLCEKICPILNPIKKQSLKSAYATIYEHRETQLSSSSGGVFTAIAKYVLEQNGVVFGASFNNDFEVEHRYVENIKDLSFLRGSKYVQSKIGNAYAQAESFLKEGKKVLFSGTPCQIAGLKAYLKQDYENLITQDIICHGVPSPMIWEKYIDYRNEIAGAKVREICFRNKKYGWRNYAVSFDFENDAKYICPLSADLYMQSFLKNLCLRPSCYDCAFKGNERMSDITLADFWGVEMVEPEMDDENGVSLVLLHTEKGHDIFSKIKQGLRNKKTDYMLALSKNMSALQSALMPKARVEFINTVQEKGFVIAEKRFLRDSILVKIRKLLSKIKNRMIKRR